MSVEGYKILGQQALDSANNATPANAVLYTVPTGTSTTISSIFVCNNSAVNAATFGIRIVKAGESTAAKQSIFTNKSLAASTTFELTTKITLDEGDAIHVSATSAAAASPTSAAIISFSAFGHTEYEALAITELQTIASKLTSIESHQNIVKNLAVGDGIHIIGPYEWLTYSTIYNLLIEKGTVLDNTDEVSAASQAKAINELKEYVAKLKVFDKWAS